MSKQLENRIDELEAKMAFQDDTIQALNDMVGKQQLELDTLRRAVELLASRQADLAASMPGEAADDEPPPHY
ncbi:MULTISPECIES: SlyX family protein [Pseudomonas]|uniref:SlyX family protein n=1 Tax=Pseudomonas TaxID=286 RepID=UPI00123A9857|nr:MULTISPECIES: SlyX family protein [Pseudomonas]QIB51393.1 SlyX family protein [Pseudomonas sp. OIL-1]